MTVVLALAASLLWGGSDFLGGTLSRRLPVGWVVAGSQGLGALALAVAVAVTGFAGGRAAGWGAAAGALGVVALLAFYRALATGTMGVVAPIAGAGAVLPVVVGIAGGDRPDPAQLAGVAVALAGVVLASGPELRAGTGGLRPLALAALAAAGFGAVIVFIARGSAYGVVPTLFVMRAVAIALLGLAALALRRRADVVTALRTRPAPADLPLLVAVAAGDVGANACYAVASRGEALLSVVSVLASLYPAVTVLLARRVHGERLRRVQVLGVAATLAGVALIALGGGAG